MRPSLRHLHNLLAATFLVISGMLACVSLFTDSNKLNSRRAARHASVVLQQNFDKLNSCAQSLLAAPMTLSSWPELEALPRYLVLYRYDNDTLSCWYNQFPVRADNISKISLYPCISTQKANLSSALTSAADEPRFVNLDRQWYIIRKITDRERSVIAGFLIKDETRENMTSGRTGVNPVLRLPGQYDVSTLIGGEGMAVYLDGKPVFNIVMTHETIGEDTTIMTALLRWLAIIFFALSAVSYLVGHRSPNNCAAVISLIAILSVISRLWESYLSNVSTFFSPLAFANDGLMDSFASLMIFNTALFLIALCLYICRRENAMVVSGDRKKSIAACVALALTIVLYVAYIVYSFKALLNNSGVTMERYLPSSFPWLTTLSFMSFSMLCASVLLLAECGIYLVSNRRGKNISVMSVGWVALYALAASVVLVAMSLRYGFVKEQHRVTGWSNMIALDRDLKMELELGRLEGYIEKDPVIRALVELGGHDIMIRDRLEAMYMGRISQNYDISVSTVNDIDAYQYLQMLVPLGQPVFSQSHFLYSYDDVLGSCYNGVISYASQGGRVSVMVCHLEPRRNASVELPPIYSYAKYTDNRLVSFSGSYPYPTLLTSQTVDIHEVKTFRMKGYCHFVNEVNADEIIVVSRPERSNMSYFVTFSSLAILIFFIIMVMRPRELRRKREGTRYFTTRMRVTMVTSLVLMLLTMTGVSVFFVYQRNESSVRNMMISKITSAQIFMEDICRDMEDQSLLHSQDFVHRIEEFTRTTGTAISLYSPSGLLFYSNEQSNPAGGKPSLMVDGTAYQSIIFSHQRFYLSDHSVSMSRRNIMYAPVFNASGRLLSIVSVPYNYLGYSLMRDALLHTATILCLFFILLIVAVLFTKHISNAIFSPLTSISQKMKAMDTGSLEEVVYDGDDEISYLVHAYNNMVAGLRSSTMELAAAERDRAWSAMARQVAHEIKNPLTPIKLNIQRLIRLKQKGDPSWQTKFDQVAQVLLENIDILTETADEFGTYAKLSTEAPVVINLDSMLQDQLLLFGESGVKITYLGMPDACVTGPRPQLSRVFVNLITNAIQALEGVEDPNVVISLRRSEAGYWDVAIEDNGPGVPAENQNRLFTPNFTTKSSGTGLGLAISRSVVESMGGTITYSRSFALNGACFTVHLPASSSSAEL